MNGHTPAPWRATPGNQYHYPYVVRGNEGGFQVMGLSLERQEADAKLIAAAPDLLAACVAHMDALDSQIRDGKYRPEYEEAIYQAQRLMGKAIAKARGES